MGDAFVTEGVSQAAVRLRGSWPDPQPSMPPPPRLQPARVSRSADSGRASGEGGQEFPQ